MGDDQNDLKKSADVIAKILSLNGVLVVTVPHPFVNMVNNKLDLQIKKTIKLGLNNIFIFRKIAPTSW